MSHLTSKGSNREAWIEENIDRDVIYGSIYGSPLTLQQGALLPMNLGSLYVQRLPFKACERLYATIFLPHCFIQRFDSSGISYLVPISPRPLQPATKDFCTLQVFLVLLPKSSWLLSGDYSLSETVYRT
jgi:hypothetical protein